MPSWIIFPKVCFDRKGSTSLDCSSTGNRWTYCPCILILLQHQRASQAAEYSLEYFGLHCSFLPPGCQNLIMRIAWTRIERRVSTKTDYCSRSAHSLAWCCETQIYCLVWTTGLLHGLYQWKNNWIPGSILLANFCKSTNGRTSATSEEKTTNFHPWSTPCRLNLEETIKEAHFSPEHTGK